MSGSWNGGPAGGGTVQTKDAITTLVNGVDAAITCDYGSTDPSAAWTGDLSRFKGRLWCKSGSPHSDQNPGLYRWELLTSPSTYGWRFLGVLGWRRFDTDGSRAVTFTPASPATANVAWTTLSFASQLDAERTAQGLSLEKVAYAVKLRVRVQASGTIPTGASNETKGYLAIRRKGDTGNGQRVFAQVSGRVLEGEVTVYLNGSEEAEFEVKVEDGTPSFAYSAWLDSWAEML